MNESPQGPEGADPPDISPLSSELLAALKAHRDALKRDRKPPPPLKLAPGDALKQTRGRQPRRPGPSKPDRDR